MASKDDRSANKHREPEDSAYQSWEPKNLEPRQGPHVGRGTPIGLQERITLEMTPPDSTSARTTAASIKSSHSSTHGHIYIQNNAYDSGTVFNRADNFENQGKRRDLFGGNCASGPGSSVLNGPLNTEEFKAIVARSQKP